MFDKDNSTNADILWTLKVIMNRFSFPSSMGLDKLFKAMFPDSEIAEQFTPLQPGVAFENVFRGYSKATLGCNGLNLAKQSAVISLILV